MQERINQLEISLSESSSTFSRLGYVWRVGYRGLTWQQAYISNFGRGRQRNKVLDSEELMADFRFMLQLKLFQVRCHHFVRPPACLVIPNRVKIHKSETKGSSLREQVEPPQVGEYTVLTSMNSITTVGFSVYPCLCLCVQKNLLLVLCR